MSPYIIEEEKYTYGSAILLHGMGELVVLGFAATKEAFLAHVEVEAFQTAVSERENIKIRQMYLIGLVGTGHRTQDN